MRRTIVVLIAVVVLSPTLSFSQTRRRRTPARTTATATQKSAQVVRTGKTRVADQVKRLTHFIYLLPGVARGIEQTDLVIARESTPTLVEQSRRSKATLRTSIQTLREVLDKLETDFRATPELQRYYIRLAGSASGTAKAEELAAAGQYDQAGRSLLEVVNRLTDVLLDMP